MEHICLDTETTGFDPAKGDRLVEIACIKLKDYREIPEESARFHCYINPQRSMPEAAFRVHGLGDEFLKDKPLFADVAQSFIDFIGDTPLVIHNAKFDMKFLNFELVKAGYAPLSMKRTIDTLQIARERFPGSPATLDALCKRYKISLENRTLHGALIDTQLLAEVFFNMFEGANPSFNLEVKKEKKRSFVYTGDKIEYTRTEKLQTRLTDEELENHQEFLSKFKTKPVWEEN